MGFSRFESAKVDGSGTVRVKGPIRFAADEQGETVATPVTFALVQGDVFVFGDGAVRGQGEWGGSADLADELKANELAQGYGVALLIKRPQEATPATDDAEAEPARPPVVQLLAWSEAVMITE